jgi:hypothetical protein
MKVITDFAKLNEDIQDKIKKEEKQIGMVFLEYHIAEKLDLSDSGYYASPRLAEAKTVRNIAQKKADKNSYLIIGYIHEGKGCSYNNIIGYAVFMKDKKTVISYDNLDDLPMDTIKTLKKYKPRFFKFLRFYPAPTDYYRHRFNAIGYETAPDGYHIKKVYLGEYIGDAVYIAKKEDPDDWYFKQE